MELSRPNFCGDYTHLETSMISILFCPHPPGFAGLPPPNRGRAGEGVIGQTISRPDLRIITTQFLNYGQESGRLLSIAFLKEQQ